MRKIIFYMVVMLLLAILAACVPQVSGEVIKSAKQRVTSAKVNEADQSSLVDGNVAFAFDLYQSLKDGEGNFFYSPYSISVALAMTYAGAHGETAQQMANTLYYNLSQDQLHPAFNNLDIELSHRGLGAKGKDGKGFRLNIVNAIWGQKGYNFLPEFLDILAENYGAGLRPLDFSRMPEESRKQINSWVAEQTEDRIKNLIPQGAVDTLTRLVLTNAIYFNAAWQYPFKENVTDKTGTFYLLDGTKITVPMMKQAENFGYTEGEGYQAVELPYDGRELSMIILLPSAGSFSEFEKSLGARQVESVIKDLKPGQVVLSMPRFEFESDFNLNKALSAMGMPAAFSPNADFSGMTGNRDLFISEIIHKAFIAVDEAGTEAAAATAVIMRLTAMPGTPVAVTVDRPFIFLIRDISTGAVLFVGRVLNPGK
jgi:serpin B